MQRILVIAGTLLLSSAALCQKPVPKHAKPLSDAALDQITAGTVTAGVSDGVVKFQGQTQTANGLVTSSGSLAMQAVPLSSTTGTLTINGNACTLQRIRSCPAGHPKGQRGSARSAIGADRLGGRLGRLLAERIGDGDPHLNGLVDAAGDRGLDQRVQRWPMVERGQPERRETRLPRCMRRRSGPTQARLPRPVLPPRGRYVVAGPRW